MDKDRAQTPGTASRVEEHAKLLAEAMKHPGVREALTVYEAYIQIRDQQLAQSSNQQFAVINATKTD